MGLIVNAVRGRARPDGDHLRLAAIGLNVHFGYTGLLNFGQAGFLAVAATASASIVATWGLSFWLGIVVGLPAACLALLLGVPRCGCAPTTSRSSRSLRPRSSGRSSARSRSARRSVVRRPHRRVSTFQDFVDSSTITPFDGADVRSINRAVSGGRTTSG